MRLRRRAGLRDGRPLTATELARYSDYFDAALLASVRVIDGRVPFWLRPDMNGVTLGDRIYLRRGVYDPTRLDGIELLGHELVHVRQYCEGMTVLRYLWASRRGYRRNPYEVEAYAIGARIRAQACDQRALASPSIARATASATSMPSTPADMMPPA